MERYLKEAVPMFVSREEKQEEQLWVGPLSPDGVYSLAKKSRLDNFLGYIPPTSAANDRNTRGK